MNYTSGIKMYCNFPIFPELIHFPENSIFTENISILWTQKGELQKNNIKIAVITIRNEKG